MEPNQTVHLENGKLQLHAQENADKLLWTDGILCITGMTFEEVMAKFERCYDINVEILRDDLPQIEFQRCKLRISEGIDHAPRGAAARGRFQVRTRYYDQYALYQITNEVRTQQPDAYEKVTENPFLPYQVLIKKENL